MPPGTAPLDIHRSYCRPLHRNMGRPARLLAPVGGDEAARGIHLGLSETEAYSSSAAAKTENTGCAPGAPEQQGASDGCSTFHSQVA